ncbi:MAG: hypothetical protein PVI52_08725, partial [Chromatiales bacterium]
MQPPLAWIGTRQVPRFLLHEGLRVANPAWQPFVTPVAKADFPAGAQADPRHFTPSQAAIKASFSVLSSFYTYLVREGRLAANPVVLIRHKSRFVRKEQLKPPIRRISTLQWDYALESAEQLDDVNPAEHERTL